LPYSGSDAPLPVLAFHSVIYCVDRKAPGREIFAGGGDPFLCCWADAGAVGFVQSSTCESPRPGGVALFFFFTEAAMLMLEGMLWFDNSPKKTLTEKVREAREFYINKYGAFADCCMVAPGEVDGELVVDGVTVTPRRGMTPGHLWIGKKEKSDAKACTA
jgi:hypothetical protein